jgi:hypothetical protein
MANYCFTAPILPGGEEKVRRFVQDEIQHNPNHDRVFQKAGISREQVWIQRTPMGDFAVASYEIDVRPGRLKSWQNRPIHGQKNFEITSCKPTALILPNPCRSMNRCLIGMQSKRPA